MVNTFNKKEDFRAFTHEESSIFYRIAWGYTPDAPLKDEDGNDQPSPFCTYTLERYPYKPSIDIVLGDILRSERQASMAELRAISEGLGADPLAAMQKALQAYVDRYDQSEAVNSFLLDGEPVWLDKATRVGLMNSTQIARDIGKIETTVWLGQRQMTIPCDAAIQMLQSLEMYALECFNQTALHKANVAALDSVEAAMQYDYTSGYPEKVMFNV